LTREEAKRLGLKCRVITDLRLEKISAVDLPCVEDAVAQVLKRAPTAKLLKDVNPSGTPEALARLADKGVIISKLTADAREGIVAAYDAGERVELVLPNAKRLFLLKRGEPVWSFNLSEPSVVEKSKADPYEELKPENRPSGEDEESEEEMHDFMSKVDEVAARDKIPRTAAMEKVRKQHPELFQQFQNRTPAAKAAPQRIEKSEAEVRFMDKVAEVAKSHGLPMTRAMNFVRTQYPDLYSQAYG
jgi:hypothetical protein